MESIISVQAVTARYEQERVIENLSLEVEKGTFLAIVGPNGSGKTTLMRLILGLMRPERGTIQLFGTTISRFKQWEKVGYIPQRNSQVNSGFPATVYEVVQSGLVGKVGLLKRYDKKHHERIMEALVEVGMEQFKNVPIGSLSGGQQQRIYIARALIHQPDLIILDEPTVGVDTKNIDSFYTLLSKLHRVQGKTLILVTHDVSAVSNLITTVACLNKSLYFHGDVASYEALSKEELSQLYGHDISLITHDHHHHGGHRHD